MPHLLELLVVFAVDGALVRSALATVRFGNKSGGRMKGGGRRINATGRKVNEWNGIGAESPPTQNPKLP